MVKTAQKTDYLIKYHALGEDRFYRSILSDAVNCVIRIKDGSYKGTSPELDLLAAEEKFLILFRREGNSLHLDIARLFRKAAHRVYRLMLKGKMIERNSKFLNLV